MEPAKGEDERKLKAEEEVFVKEKHKDAVEIYKTLARNQGLGSCDFVSNIAFKDFVESWSCN